MLPTYWLLVACAVSAQISSRSSHTTPPPSLGTSSLPGVTHTQAPKSTPEQLRHTRSGRDAGVMAMMPNALQPSCLCLCFSSDGPVFLPSRTSPDCRFPLIAALFLSVYSNQHIHKLLCIPHTAYSLSKLSGVSLV